MAKKPLADTHGELFFDLVENANDLIQIVSAEGFFIYVNKAWQATLGYSAEEAKNLKFTEVVAPDELEHCKQAFNQIMADGEPRDVETVFITKHGERVSVRGSISARVVDGEPVTTRGIFHNISYEKEHEENLRTIERRFRAIFDSSTLGVSIANAEGRIQLTNKAFQEMVGYSEQELEGIRFTEITHPDDRKTNLQKHRDFVEGKTEAYDLEKRYIKKNGETIWVQISVSKIADERGDIARVICVIENIDDRKNLEADLRHTNQLQKTILDSANLTIIALDKNGVIQSFNKTAERLLGYSAEEMIGNDKPPFHDVDELRQRTKKLNEELGTDFKTGIDTFIGKINLTKKPDEYELTYISKSGERIPILLSASPIFDEAGEISGYLGVGLDLRERKRALDTRKEYEQFFSLSVDMLCIAGLDGYFKKVNPAFKRTLGYTEDELTNKPFIEFVHHEDIDNTLKEMESLSHGKLTFDFINRYRCKDGSYKWLSWATRADLDKNILYAVAHDITALKEHQEKLERSEARLKEAERLAQLGNWEYDIRRQTVRWSDEVFRIFDLDLGEHIVDPNLYWKYVHPDDVEHISQVIGRAIEEVKDYKVTHRIKTKKGNVKHITGIAHPVREEGGKLRKLVGTVQDITERTEVLEELERSRAFSEAIAKQSPNLIYLIDFKTREYVYSNGYMGFQPEYLRELGKDLMKEMIHPDDLEHASAHFADLRKLPDGDVYSYEQRLKNKKGEWRWMFCRETIFQRNENGKPLQVLGVGVDITDRKKAEDELAKLSVVADKTDNGVVISDEKGRVEWVNEGFRRITGYKLEEVKGKRPSDVLSGPDTNMENVRAMQKREKRYESYSFEVLNYRNDGKPIWLSVTNTPVMDDDIFAGKYIEIISDITEKKNTEFELIKAKEQAERSARIKQEFLANMSHEIRTPMNSVLGYTKLLKSTDLDESQRKAVETIDNAGENLLVIINDILNFSKMESGRLEIVEKEFNLPKLVTELNNLFDEKVREKNLDLNFTINSAVPEYVYGDEVRTHQILVNLVGNAIKFTEEGEIDVRVKPVKKTDKEVEVEFQIRDTGIGIAKNKIHQVFESFRQAKSDISRKYGGTGLGLTIVKRLIELQGGTLDVKSKLGEGTVFTFTLKYSLDKKKKRKKPKEEAPPETKTLQGVKVLLCEDNKMNQDLVEGLLVKPYGIDLDIAENGKEGLEKLEKGHYDLVLMDVQMPEMDGLEATRKIRQSDQPKIKNIPIIAMTANAMEQERKKAFQIGMDEYVSKPFRVEDLVRKMVAQLNKQKGEESPIYDLSNVHEMSGGDPEFVKGMISSFLENTPEDLKTLQKLHAEGNTKELQKQAHKLKSSLSLMGIQKGVDLANRIENGEESDELVSDLVRACEEAISELIKSLEV